MDEEEIEFEVEGEFEDREAFTESLFALFSEGCDSQDTCHLEAIGEAVENIADGHIDALVDYDGIDGEWGGDPYA